MDNLYSCRRIRMVGDRDSLDYRPETREELLLTLSQVERMDQALRRATNHRECWVVCLSVPPQEP